ncbi:hypothetical protein B0H13DRAFT_2317689 [Mycena leptocephala]|nr:hypothetical protein B0H13DRAFT_2317689 [Mycena leptocephala]
MSYPTELTVSWVSVSAVELFTFQPTFIAKLSGLPRYFRISDMPTSIFATSPIAVLARSTVRLVAFIQHPPVGGFDGIQIPTPRYLDVEIMTSDEPQCLAPCRPRVSLHLSAMPLPSDNILGDLVVSIIIVRMAKRMSKVLLLLLLLPSLHALLQWVRELHRIHTPRSTSASRPFFTLAIVPVPSDPIPLRLRLTFKSTSSSFQSFASAHQLRVYIAEAA